MQYCFIYRPSNSTVLEEDGIEPRTVANFWRSNTVRSNLSDRSHPQLSLSHQFLAACLQRKFKYKVSAFFFENPY
jgi:hypothetical protein